MKKLSITALTLTAFVFISCEEPQQPQGGAGAPSVNAGQPATQKQVEPKPQNIVRGYSWITGLDTKNVQLDPNLLRKNIYVAFDASGSMDEVRNSGRERKIDVARRAVSQFAGLVPSDTNLGLLTFGDIDPPTERIPLGLNNRVGFAKVVSGVQPGPYGTPLDNAIRVSYERLKVQALKQLGYGEYHLVVVTDGEANWGHDPTSVVNDVLANSPVVIHTIGFYIGKSHTLNRPGKTIYKEANSPKELEEGLSSVLAESSSFDTTSFDQK